MWENNIWKDKKVIEANSYNEGLKYFQIGYVDKKDRVYYEYSGELSSHIKELVDLDNAVDFRTDKTIKIALSDEEFEIQLKELENVKKLYVGEDVMVSADEEVLLNNKGVELIRIPNYYYKEIEGGTKWVFY